MKLFFRCSAVFICCFIFCRPAVAQNNSGSLMKFYKTIGWTITIPVGWTIIDQAESADRHARGKSLIEESAKGKFYPVQITHLANFKKNEANKFRSNMEPFQSEQYPDFKDQVQFTKQLLCRTYEVNGVIFDSTATETVKVSGKDFVHYNFVLYNANREVVLKQEIYCRKVKDYVLNVMIVYNNDTDYKEMLQAFQTSVFQ